jgi:hypothetical protein
MNYKTNIIAPELHDAQLNGVLRDALAQTVDLVFMKADGQYVTVVLSEVAQFRCTDFGLQNVVFQFIVQDVNETLTESEIKSKVTWMFTNDSGELLANATEIEAVVRLVMTGKILLIVLTPSWGAQLVATAKGIS